MNGRYVEAVTKYMIKQFYMEGGFKKTKYYTKDMICIAPRNQENKTCRILHCDCRLCFNRQDAASVAGSYQLIRATDDGKKTRTLCRYSGLLQCQGGKIRLTMLHISEEPGTVFHLTDVVERTFFLSEEEVLYLESGHNRVFWHTQKETVEVTGTLLSTEGGLPSAFVRIHKSFIVNSLHVKKINRCYVELTNGECLQIPVKKYTDVRRELIGKRDVQGGPGGFEKREELYG